MKSKKVMCERDEHGPRHVTPAGRSVFYDLFPKAEADELVMRSTLLMSWAASAVGTRPTNSPFAALAEGT